LSIGRNTEFAHADVRTMSDSDREAEERSEDVTCPTCGRADFASESGMKVHHSKVHGESIAGVAVECEWCGAAVRRPQYALENREMIFCDLDCKGAWRQENWTGEDTPRWKGGSVTTECHYCGETFERRRDQVAKYERSFCGSTCLGNWRSDAQRGADNPVWTGGSAIRSTVRQLIADEPWETIAERERADACELCETTETSDGRAMAVHHIVPVMAGGCNSSELLMTLCPACHRRVEAYTRRIVEPVLVEE
jgi:5-methylcytosine-specific restriction endonuclease McrA